MSDKGRKRVVITGLGAVTPLGNDVESSWASLIAGESGAARIEQFDATGYPVDFACELKGFEPTTWIEYKQARRMDRFAQMVLSAARQAETDSGLWDFPVFLRCYGKFQQRRSRILYYLLPGIIVQKP